MALRAPRVLAGRPRKARSVRSRSGHWEPPEGLSPEDAQAVIAAATCERDRLLMRVLWATGARVNEVLALRPMDVHRDSLVLPNRKNPSRATKRIYLPGGPQDLPGSCYCGDASSASLTTAGCSQAGSVAGPRAACRPGASSAPPRMAAVTERYSNAAWPRLTTKWGVARYGSNNRQASSSPLRSGGSPAGSRHSA